MPIVWLAGLWTMLILVWQQAATDIIPLLINIAVVATIPGIVHLGLARFLKEEWAQALVLIGWTAFAAIAIASTGNLFTPLIAMAVLPIVAAVSFGRMNRVLEATALTALVIGAIAIAGPQGLLPRNVGWLAQIPILELAGLVLSLIVIGSGLSAILPLMDSQARLRDALFRKSPHMDFCVDQRGRVVSASDRAKNWSKAGSITGLFENGQALSKVRHALHMALTNNHPASFVIPVGGQQDLHQLHIGRLDEHRAILSLRNVAGQFARERELQAERDTAVTASHDKTLFLAGMSHELRTPLNAIIGFSDMMKARLFGPIPAKYAEYADLIHESGRHLVDLVGDVLDMSKIESEHYKLNKEPFDICEVVRSCVKLMQLGADEAGVRLSVDLPDHAVPVLADRKAMRQILFNLLSNAIKFTPGDGRVTTGIELDGDTVILEVRDNGVGMSEEDASRVGQPFQQAESAKNSDARGTGLGLSLVKALSELHGGTFALRSELGQGTRIILDLPIVNEAELGKKLVQELDVRNHIRRALAATEEIAAVSARLSS